MGRKYNTPYKKGKFHTSAKARLADLSKTSRNTTENRALWLSDPRKYDYPGEDTRTLTPSKTFKYKKRSFKLYLGKKPGRENKRHRRYKY